MYVCVCDTVLAWGKVSQISARLIISMVSVSAAVRDTKEAACLPVPKAFSTSSFASTSPPLFTQLRSLVWSQIYSGTHKDVIQGREVRGVRNLRIHFTRSDFSQADASIGFYGSRHSRDGKFIVLHLL